MKRVVVTGIGAVSPIGNTFTETYRAAKEGLSGLAHVSRFDVSDMPWKVGGELKRFDPNEYLSGKEIKRLDLFAQYAVAAACMAAEDAGLADRETEGWSGQRMPPGAGIIIGSSRGGIAGLERAIISSSLHPRRRRSISPYLMPATTVSMAPSYAAQKLGIRGRCLGISNACASGAAAIGEAFHLIRAGYKQPVLCGGAEAPLCRICFEGYGSSGALSKTHDATASRPFDRTRDGFVLSEGACVLVLEEHSVARERGAQIYGEIVGYGNTCDSFHQTAPSAGGEAVAMIEALEDAGLPSDFIGLINAHGTSTRLGDRSEAQAIRRAFGGRAGKIPVTSLKSVTGHMLAASGALETAVTLVSMREGCLLPTLNFAHPDPECELDIVTELRDKDVSYSLSNSFGFGGVNAVLVLRRMQTEEL